MSSEKRIIHLHIPSELGYEKVAMGAARSVAQAMGFSGDRILDLQTAVAEACTNAMEHGNLLNAAQRVENGPRRPAGARSGVIEALTL